MTEQQELDAGERRLLALVQNSADLVLVLEPDATASFVSPASLRGARLPPRGPGRSDALMIYDTNQHEDLQIIHNALILGLRNYSIRHGSKEIINFYKFLQDLLHCAQNTVILLEIESKKVL